MYVGFYVQIWNAKPLRCKGTTFFAYMQVFIKKQQNSCVFQKKAVLLQS